MSKQTATRSRSEHAKAVKRANRRALVQWWLIGILFVAALVLMVVFLSQDGTAVPTHGGALGRG
ncbi:MAG: hypothetical protein ACR2OH_06345 [Microthrixaceae bacterium]